MRSHQSPDFAPASLLRQQRIPRRRQGSRRSTAPSKSEAAVPASASARASADCRGATSPYYCRAQPDIALQGVGAAFIRFHSLLVVTSQQRQHRQPVPCGQRLRAPAHNYVESYMSRPRLALARDRGYCPSPRCKARSSGRLTTPSDSIASPRPALRRSCRSTLSKVTSRRSDHRGGLPRLGDDSFPLRSSLPSRRSTSPKLSSLQPGLHSIAGQLEHCSASRVSPRSMNGSDVNQDIRISGIQLTCRSIAIHETSRHRNY